MSILGLSKRLNFPLSFTTLVPSEPQEDMVPNGTLAINGLPIVVNYRYLVVL